MANRRGDFGYLLFFAAVAVVGYFLSTQDAEEAPMFAVDPNYRAPQMEFPEASILLPDPVFAFRYAGRFEGPSFPRVFFADEMELALLHVRNRLLNESEVKTVEGAVDVAEFATDRTAHRVAGTFE